MDILSAAQQYVTKWLLSYDDELFGLLYYDVDNLAESITTEVFQQERSISFYGVKGIGKTTLMQGVLWHGLRNAKSEKFLPVLVSVTGANSVSNLADLEDKFYRSVLAGLLISREINDRYEHIKKNIAKFAPWAVSTGLSALALVFPPASLASDVAKEGTKKLLDKFGVKEPEKLVISKEIEPKFACDFILGELKAKNVYPVFIIDELDKVANDTFLTDFFNGNQGWFQGKRSLISLSYTFGKSVEDAVITSVRRFSTVKKVPGVTALEQFKSIMYLRLILGVSLVNQNETEAKRIVDRIFAPEAYEKIVNNYVPNLHLMLEASHRSLKKAMAKKAEQVTLREAIEDNENGVVPPNKLELLILNKLAESQMGPTALGNSLSRERATVSRPLKLMLEKDWVGKMGTGKNVTYFIKQKGESARHLSKS